ncbi:phage head morphogenesis protein [Bordetella hinzii]|uniref:phage head morphogenesis protein n=1 Tax=Bordetella hinzii TaxID=103855 RepID=UPI0011514F54|nr:phage minor head protein [Bordetella hinzii]QDJ57263.1 phage head morphogenesis protein [Bordetella hinzii]
MASPPTPAASRRSRTPRPPKQWRYPLAAEQDYARALRITAEAAIEAVATHVLPVLPQVLRQDDLRNTPAGDDGWFESLRRAFMDALGAATVADGTAQGLVAMVARRVEKYNKEQYHRLLRRAYGVDVFKAEPRLAKILLPWEAENIGLIKSIPEQYLDTLHGRVVAAVRKGTSLRDMTAQIRDTYDLPRNRAELIARDQIGKLNGGLTEYRQTNIGVKKYRWRGVLDERERDEHVAREGQEFEWDNPPADGHPGKPIRCRCWAEAVLPALDDLDALIVH